MAEQEYDIIIVGSGALWAGKKSGLLRENADYSAGSRSDCFFQKYL